MTNGKSKAPFSSKLYLPKLDKEPKTIFEYLITRFPHLEAEILASRIEEKELFLDDNSAITLSTPYKAGLTIFYHRATDKEEIIPFQEQVIFENDEILVVDKPPFLPVTPSGKYVNECLLSRLIHKYDYKELTPIHRIDLETSGLVLFSKNNQTRHLYHQLFQTRQVVKQYYAVCQLNDCKKLEIGNKWTIANRIATGEPWYRMKIVEGEANATTEVQLIDYKEEKALFLLTPITGKKHQLRLHLTSLGFNILNDLLYPEIIKNTNLDYSKVLQLLAYHLSFKDPLINQEIKFFSNQKLNW
ncbi:MAG: pseudouridine synthase [Blastocatellia bacterium]|nr:pseudouridine synthase [Blastocatellia bacterium]MBN8722278.1 pseudouridine synthase [Acidobacteriota bacterium]